MNIKLNLFFLCFLCFFVSPALALTQEITVEKNINNPGAVKNVFYKITAQNTSIESIFINDDAQNIIQVRENTAYIKTKAEKQTNYDFPYPFDNSNYEEYLKSGPFINANNAKIRAVADEIKKGETLAARVAHKASKWVYKNIKNTSPAEDFSDSVQALETKSGDSTERSVLLASILRAAGIPARVVSGLAYANNPQNTFVYHMWVQAYVGRWISFDPSQPYDVFTPLHLAMAQSALNNVSDKKILTDDVISSFSDIDIEILNLSEPTLARVRGLPRIKLIEQEYLPGSNIININISGSTPAKTGIDEIKLSDTEIKRDSLKTAFYNFTKGDTRAALADLKEHFKSIDPDDDYAKMQLALKLINMTYFNFADNVFDEVREKEIWGKMIEELKVLYFPKNLMPEKAENVQVTAYYFLSYENRPEHVINLTQDAGNYDYLYYLRALAFKKLKNYEEAKEEIDKAIRINPENLSYKLDLINILSAQNEVRQAQTVLGQLDLQAKKHNIKNKEFWKKFDIYEKWLKVKEFREDPVTSKYYEAYYYFEKEELDTALDILNKLVYRNKKPYLQELLGELFYKLGYYDAARKAYKEALALNENRAKSLIGLGNIYFITGNNKLAEKYYLQATEKFPRNVDALLAMAKLTGYQGNAEKALDYFKKILSIQKDNNEVIYNTGIILANNKKFDEAEKMLEKALSADPMDSLIWLDLAKIEISRQEYLDAVKYLKYINYIDENNPYYYYYMAIIFSKNNKQAESEKYLKKALQLNPDFLMDISQEK